MAHLSPDYSTCYCSLVSPKESVLGEKREEEKPRFKVYGETPGWSSQWRAHQGLLSWRGPPWLLVAPAYLVLRTKNSTFSFVLGFTTIPRSGLSSSPKTSLHLSSWHVHSGIPTCYCQAWFSMCLPPAKYLPTCLAIWDRWHSHTLPPREYFYYQRWNFHPQRPSHAVHRDVFTLLLSGLPWIQAACPPTHPFLAFPQSRGGREGREEPQPRG